MLRHNCFLTSPIVAIIIVTATSLAARERTHSEIEVIAHGYAYDITGNFGLGVGNQRPGLDSLEPYRRMRSDGYTLLEAINDDHIGVQTGLQAIVIRDDRTGQVYIAFRGTEGPGDLIDDAGRIGHWQYEGHRELLDRWSRDYSNAVVTGHSLGAALGQRYIADHPDRVRQGVFFNAPGVDQSVADRFNLSTGAPGQPPRTPIQYYQGIHDAVSEYGGQVHLRGRVTVASGGAVDPGFQGSPGGAVPASPFLAAHRGWMLQDGRSPNAVGEGGTASFTNLTEVDFDTYERDRQANLADGAILTAPFRFVGRVGRLVGQVGDTLVNRSWAPGSIRRGYNSGFGNRGYAEPNSGDPSQYAFNDRRWREIADQTIPGKSATVNSSTNNSAPINNPSPNADFKWERVKVPKLPSWYDK